MDAQSENKNCPFCHPQQSRVFLSDDLIIGLWDGYPVSEGHALLVPKRHIATWFDATQEEQQALTTAIEIAKTKIERQHAPDGYNVGFNAGEAAGQTVFHLHVHVIPRYRGDVSDPRGGVRGVIPAKAAYWKQDE
jgi:diadenosine tetraphosphate (Ap4A) HIT family hydrolase